MFNLYTTSGNTHWGKMREEEAQKGEINIPIP